MERKKRNSIKFILWSGLLALLAVGLVAVTWHVTNMILNREKFPSFPKDGFFEIYDAQDYEEFWNYARKEGTEAKGRLCSDIYLNDTSDLDNWYKTPPENKTEGSYHFKGIFDGNGYTIYGLYSEKGYGLTDWNDGRIENVTIKDSLVTGENNSGGICSLNYGYGVISNCSFQGEVEINKGSNDENNSVSGICTRNLGLVQGCEFAGEVKCRETMEQTIVRAGICMENEGEIRDCYNLTSLTCKRSEWVCLAISDSGEMNCYMRENSGWEASPDGRILALNDRQCLSIDDFLKNGLYEYYYPSDTGLFAFEKEVPETPVNVPMKKALQDERVTALIWDTVLSKNASFSDFTFEATETEEQEGFVLNISFRDETLRIVKTLQENRDITSNEELWRIAAKALDEKSTDSFEHETYRLYDRWEGLKNAERLMLYHTGQEMGFFCVRGEILYQVAFQKTGGSTELFDSIVQSMKQFPELQVYAMEKVTVTDFLKKEPDSLWETAFFSVVEKKLMDNGIDWEDIEIRELIYDTFKEPEEFHTQEEIRKLNELTVRMSQLKYVDNLKDLEYLTGLKSLTIYGRGYGDISVIYVMGNLDAESFPNLTELNMIKCGLGDISFVEVLPRLTALSFYGNDIRDISPLTACKNLKRLSLAYNDITDITPLSQLSELEELGLQYNEIADIDVLCKLNNLVAVNLTANHISDLSPLGELYKLTNLGLADNEITDISPLRELTNLYNLSLDANQIQDISPLSDMKEMEWLGLSWNLIEDFTPIQGMEKLFFLAVTDNPSQDIGDLILTPDLSIGTWYTDRNMEMEELKPLLYSAFPGQEIEIEDFAIGDMNSDGISDMAIIGYSGEVKAEDGSISQWGERKVYLFFGTAQGTYIYRDKADVRGPAEGGIYGDPYQGIAIMGGKLVVQCYGGSNFRWALTEIYEWEAEGLTQLYELSLDNWILGNGGYDWYVTDLKAGTERKYAIAGTLEGNMEKLLLSDSVYDEEKNNLQSVIEKEVTVLEEKLGEGAVVPDITSYFYQPDIGDSYYEYEVHDRLYSTKRTTEWVLDKAVAGNLPGAVKLPIPIYTSEEIKGNYDRLAGVELPDGFYLGEKEGKPCLLVYERCDVTEKGEYVHVCKLKEKRGDDWWSEAEVIYYHEDTDGFEVKE